MIRGDCTFVHDRLSGTSVTCRKSEQPNAFKNERRNAKKPLRRRRCFLRGAHPAISKGLLASSTPAGAPHGYFTFQPPERTPVSNLHPAPTSVDSCRFMAREATGLVQRVGVVLTVGIRTSTVDWIAPGLSGRRYHTPDTKTVPSPRRLLTLRVKLGYGFGGVLGVHYNRFEVNSIDLSTIRCDSPSGPDSGSLTHTGDPFPQTLRDDRRPFWPVFPVIARRRNFP